AEQIVIVLLWSRYFSFFFFSSRRRHTRSDRDWSSDVCSSDLDQSQRGECDPGLAAAAESTGVARAAAGGASGSLAAARGPGAGRRAPCHGRRRAATAAPNPRARTSSSTGT